jgi:hypothetical protein
MLGGISNCSNHIPSSYAGGGAVAAAAVSRSAELLSCARTAVKLARKRHHNSSSKDYDKGSVVGQKQGEEQHGWWSVDPDKLRLHPDGESGGRGSRGVLGSGAEGVLDPSIRSSREHQYQQHPFLEEAVELLRGMQGELLVLEGLVRRRGQTNDPTDEIKECTGRLQADTRELLEACLPRIVPAGSRGQSKRHHELVRGWIEAAARQQADRLQLVLKTRAQVLSEQAQRRKLFASSTATAAGALSAGPLSSSVAETARTSSAASASSSAALSRANNPLFTLPAPTPAALQNSIMPRPQLLQQQQQQQLQQQQQSDKYSAEENGRPGGPSSSLHAVGYGGAGRPTVASSSATTAAATALGGSYYYGSQNAYGGGYYGSSTSSSAPSSLRQRRQPPPVHSSQQQHGFNQAQAQLQVRLQERQARQRLEEARQAESSLAELGTLFGKMSALVSSQGETVAKIEDDVESALLDVRSGHGEIQQLYGIKKGNRALILKTFAILIFFIVFMRLYKS